MFRINWKQDKELVEDTYDRHSYYSHRSPKLYTFSSKEGFSDLKSHHLLLGYSKKKEQEFRIKRY